MIASCEFIGRTGNQLWQIAATVNYAIQNGYTVGFPSRSLNDRLWPIEFKGLPVYNRPLPKFEQHHSGRFDPIPKNGKGMRLKGFFQSYKYIEGQRTIKEVKRLIGYIDEIPTKGIAIHVRRGDYVENAHAFPPLPVDYYKKALEQFEYWDTSKMRYDIKGEIHVFSDDPNYCKEAFKDLKYFDKMVFHEVGAPVADLFDMSRYEHQIIANSSFSYWAAILNPNPKKVVICPDHSQYYGPANSHLDTSTLYPPHFTQIKF